MTREQIERKIKELEDDVNYYSAKMNDAEDEMLDAEAEIDTLIIQLEELDDESS